MSSHELVLVKEREESKKESHPTSDNAVIQQPTKRRKSSASLDPEYVLEESGKAKRKKTREKQVSGHADGRVFTNEDEIVILREIDHYCVLRNIIDPSLIKTNEVCATLIEKGKLSSNFTKTQVYEKMRSMRKKFQRNWEKKCGSNGEEPVFRSEHDARVFKYSERVWGGIGDVEEKDEDEGDQEKLWDKYPYLCESFESPFLMKEKIKFIGDAKAKELEMKWIQLRIKESELNIKRHMLEVKTAKEAMQAHKEN